MRNILGIVFMLCVVLAVSCDAGDDCREELDVVMQSEFYEVVYDAYADAYKNTKVSKPLYINGLGSDSMISNGGVVGKFAFMLKDEEELSQVVISDTLNVVDTVSIYHSNAERFISLQCGCIVEKTIVDVETTTNLIDSVIVSESFVTTERLFICRCI